MRRKIRMKKPNRHKTKLGLPDLEHVKSAVPEAEVVRRKVLGPLSFRLDHHIQPKQAKNRSGVKASLGWSKQRLLDARDPNSLLTTNELASLIGFKPKTIRRWVSRKLLNYLLVGNRLRFRLAAVELFLAQREVRK